MRATGVLLIVSAVAAVFGALSALGLWHQGATVGVAIALCISGAGIAGVCVAVTVIRRRSRRVMDGLRRSLASTSPTLAARDVELHVLSQVTGRLVHARRLVDLHLAGDSLYVLDAGRGTWGARVRLGGPAEGPGEMVLKGPPALFVGDGMGVAPEGLPEPVQPYLSLVGQGGLVLEPGIETPTTWLLPLPDATEWFAAMKTRVP